MAASPASEQMTSASGTSESATESISRTEDDETAPPSLAAASGAKHGMFAHLPEEAVYFISSGDASNGQAYTLHFEADQFPPVGAFWSLTMYYDELPYNLIENPIDRFVELASNGCVGVTGYF